jgi:hypothetical protein
MGNLAHFDSQCYNEAKTCFMWRLAGTTTVVTDRTRTRCTARSVSAPPTRSGAPIIGASPPAGTAMGTFLFRFVEFHQLIIEKWFHQLRIEK